MPTRYKRKFKPEKGYIFKIVYRDKEYKEKMANVVIKNRIEPYLDEIFTSWLARNATINFLQTPTFINYYFPEYKNRLLNRDADILVDRKMAKNFARRMMLNEKGIFNTSLQSYIGFLNETIEFKTRNHLITPMKIKGSYPNIKGLRYCPYCLKEEEYFKKEWRLSFYTVCPKHKRFLLNKCPQCKEPVLLTKRKLDIPSFNCWNCGFIYKNAETEKIHANSLAADYLIQALEILENGYFTLNGKWYYSIFYFRILKHIAKLIYQYGYRNWDIFEKEKELHRIEIIPPEKTKGKFLEEIITLKEAFIVFTTAFSILNSSKSFEYYVNLNNIPIYKLNQDLNYLPFWYERIIEKFYRQAYYVTFEEAKNACKWMKKRNIQPSYLGLSRLLGVKLDKRKRPELISLF